MNLLRFITFKKSTRQPRRVCYPQNLNDPRLVLRLVILSCS